MNCRLTAKFLVSLLMVYSMNSVCAKANLINITLQEGGFLPLTFPSGRPVPLAKKNLGTVTICELGVSLAGDNCNLDDLSDSIIFLNVGTVSYYQFCSDADEALESGLPDNCELRKGNKFIREGDGSPVYVPGPKDPGFVGSELHPVAQYTLVSEVGAVPEPSLLVPLSLSMVVFGWRRTKAAPGRMGHKIVG